MNRIPFNRPYMTGKELWNVSQAHARGHLAGDGSFTKQCNAWLEQRTGARSALLTHSCTAALEMAAILAGIGPGDEVILPSYTFVSTANAFVLRGGVPVFVDIRPDTLNIDETKIEAAITPRTKAIVPVHYAGVGCEMDRIMTIAGKHGLFVVEDAAQGVNAFYDGRALGSIGDLGCYSFHETKNYICGEGGALCVNRPDLVRRAEIIRDKGTNRQAYFRGEVDKYTWVAEGSSYVLSDVLAAILDIQLDKLSDIQARRAAVVSRYRAELADWSARVGVRLPPELPDREPNHHVFYLLYPDETSRDRALDRLRERGVMASFHYVPLHSAPQGRALGAGTGFPVTDRVSATLLRLPLHPLMSEDDVDHVVESVRETGSR